MYENYVVFRDDPKGLIEIPLLRGSTVTEMYHNIALGNINTRYKPPSQESIYYIYKSLDISVRRGEKYVSIYKFDASGRGSKTENSTGSYYRCVPGYAMIEWDEGRWIFTDVLPK